MASNSPTGWTFLTSHARVLLCVARTRACACARSANGWASRSGQCIGSSGSSLTPAISRVSACGVATVTRSTRTCRCPTRSHAGSASAICWLSSANRARRRPRRGDVLLSPHKADHSPNSLSRSPYPPPTHTPSHPRRTPRRADTGSPHPPPPFPPSTTDPHPPPPSPPSIDHADVGDRRSTLENERRAMRDRHFPRLCRSCQAPMAHQEGACWRCGTQWASEEASPTPLRAIAIGRLAYAVAELGRADARRDAERWTTRRQRRLRGGGCPAARGRVGGATP